MYMYCQSGVTLIELVVAMLIVAALSAIAIPGYRANVEQANADFAGGCLRQFEMVIQRFYIESHQYPASIDEIVPPGNCQTDPWGNPYRYLRLAGKKGKGGNRKDGKENPLNADYDLYSMGKDGKTSQSLRPKVSHDDIIRAKNGAYIGLAEDY